MISITIFKDSDNRYRGFKSEGHAGYDDNGRDIICASVSVLVINTANSIERFTDDKFDGSIDEKNASFEFYITESISRESDLLIKSLVLGVENIRDEYGEQYINIKFEEV